MVSNICLQGTSLSARPLRQALGTFTIVESIMIQKFVKLILLFILFCGCSSKEKAPASQLSSKIEDSIPMKKEQKEEQIKVDEIVEPEKDFQLLREFDAYQGDIVISGDSIKVYEDNPDRFFITNSSRADSLDILMKQIYPDYKGESHLLFISVWQNDSFVQILGNKPANHPDIDYGIDSDNSVALSIADTIISKIPIKRFDKLLIKKYEMQDLDEDNDEEIIIVYSVPEQGKRNLGYYYGIFIIDYEDEDYKISFHYHSSYTSRIGNVEIKDLTGDGKKEIILFGVGVGGSGYTTSMQVFGYN